MNLNTFDLKGQDIVFFFGAGLSVDAGISSLAEIMTIVEKNFAGQQEQPDPNSSVSKFVDIYYYFKKNSIKRPHLAKDHVQFSAYNIEDILSSIRNVNNDRKDPFRSTFTSIDRTLLEIIGNDYRELEKAHHYLSSIVIDKIIDQTKKCDESDAKIEYLFFLFFFLLELGESINVFTLNFDLVLEKAHKKFREIYKIDRNLIETGFSENNVFSPESMDYDPKKRVIYYNKIHGSLNWKRDKINNDIIQVVEEEFGNNYLSEDWKKNTKNLFRILEEDNVQDEGSEIIFGTSEKYRSENPYIYLYTNLIKAIKKAKILIVVGYSYNDEHINHAFKNALKYNPELYILNVSPDLKDNTRSWLNENKKNSVKISQQEYTKKETDEEKGEYLYHILKNKDYYDIHYGFKLYLYARNYEEDALFITKIYYKYLNLGSWEYDDVLKDLGYTTVNAEEKEELINYITNIGEKTDQLLGKNNNFAKNLIPSSKEWSENIIKKVIHELNGLSAGLYSKMKISNRRKEKKLCEKYIKELDDISFLYQKFFFVFISSINENLQLHRKLSEDEGNFNQLFLCRLRIIEQILCVHYFIDFLNIPEVPAAISSEQYQDLNAHVTTINDLISLTPIHELSKHLVSLLKYPEKLKFDGRLPGNDHISSANRRVIRVISDIEKDQRKKIKEITKTGIGAFIDKNKFIRELIEIYIKKMEVRILETDGVFSDSFKVLNNFFKNPVNDFKRYDLLELHRKMESNNKSFINIFKSATNDSIEHFLNSNEQNRRLGVQHFRDKIAPHGSDRIFLRRSTARRFFVSELRIRNIYKYLNDYYLNFEF